MSPIWYWVSPIWSDLLRFGQIWSDLVIRVTDRDLGLKCCKRRRGQELNEANRQAGETQSITDAASQVPYSESGVNFMWFTDEKVFTVATPRNSQNDRLYVAASTTKKHILLNVFFVHDRPSVVQ